MALSETAPFCVSGKVVARPHGHIVLPGRFHDALVFAAGAVAAVVLLLGTASFLAPTPVPNLVASLPLPFSRATVTAGRTFYDDGEVPYAIDRRVTGWDAKRAHWLNGSSVAGEQRVVMVSGSQSPPCKGVGGDNLLLRFLKNKQDYCRLHGIDLIYNTALLHPAMLSYWTKIPTVRATMLAHPEAEWVWWVDADAVLTDMDFSLPLGKYRDHNLVVYGWPREVYGARSWVGLNAGVFLIRNCQWSLDFMDAWARMGPASPEYDKWGKVLMDTLHGKSTNDSDDQSAMVYMLANNPKKWGSKTYLEREYYFQGYWAEIVDRLDAIAARYAAVLHRRPRHAEREHLRYAAARNADVRRSVPGPAGGGQSGWRRPFITHFTGCQPCGGEPNRIYTRRSCAEGMHRALTFADDQVLRAYGFRHAGPLSDDVEPLPTGRR